MWARGEGVIGASLALLVFVLLLVLALVQLKDLYFKTLSCFTITVVGTVFPLFSFFRTLTA